MLIIWGLTHLFSFTWFLPGAGAWGISSLWVFVVLSAHHLFLHFLCFSSQAGSGGLSGKVLCLHLTKTSAGTQARPTRPFFLGMWESGEGPGWLERGCLRSRVFTCCPQGPFWKPGLFQDSFNSWSDPKSLWGIPIFLKAVTVGLCY